MQQHKRPTKSPLHLWAGLLLLGLLCLSTCICQRSWKSPASSAKGGPCDPWGASSPVQRGLDQAGVTQVPGCLLATQKEQTRRLLALLQRDGSLWAWNPTTQKFDQRPSFLFSALGEDQPLRFQFVAFTKKEVETYKSLEEIERYAKENEETCSHILPEIVRGCSAASQAGCWFAIEFRPQPQEGTGRSPRFYPSTEVATSSLACKIFFAGERPPQESPPEATEPTAEKDAGPHDRPLPEGESQSEPLPEKEPPPEDEVPSEAPPTEVHSESNDMPPSEEVGEPFPPLQVPSCRCRSGYVRSSKIIKFVKDVALACFWSNQFLLIAGRQNGSEINYLYRAQASVPFTSYPLPLKKGTAGLASALALSPQRKFLAAGGGGFYKIWALQQTGTKLDNPVLLSTNYDSSPAARKPLKNSSRTVSITDLEFAPQGGWFAISTNGGLFLWTQKNGVLTPKTPPAPLNSKMTRALSFSPDGAVLAVAEAPATLRFLDPAQPKKERSYLLDSSPSSRINDVVFSPDGIFVAVALTRYDEKNSNWMGDIQLWRRLISKQEVIGLKMVFQAPGAFPDEGRRVAFSSDGRLLAAIGYKRNLPDTTKMDLSVKIWERTATRPYTFHLNTSFSIPSLNHAANDLMPLVFSPDCATLLAGYYYGYFLWYCP